MAGGEPQPQEVMNFILVIGYLLYAIFLRPAAPPSCSALHLTLRYAKDLDVGPGDDDGSGHRCKVYATALTTGQQFVSAMQSTRAHQQGGKDPVWDHTFTFSVCARADGGGQALTLLFQCEDLGRQVGRAVIPMKDLLEGKGYGTSDSGETVASAQVTSPSSKPQGLLLYAYGFKGTSAAAAGGEEPEAPKHPIWRFLTDLLVLAVILLVSNIIFCCFGDGVRF